MSPITEHPRRQYVTIAEAAEYLRCTQRTVRAMLNDGRLTKYQSGTRLIRVDLNDLDAHMAGGR